MAFRASFVYLIKLKFQRPEEAFTRAGIVIFSDNWKAAFGHLFEPHLIAMLAKAQSQHPDTIGCTSNFAEKVYNHGLWQTLSGSQRCAMKLM